MSARPLLWIALLVAALLLGIWVLTSAGLTEVITPPPDSPAVGLMTALLAHREEGALNTLSSAAQQATSRKELHQLAQGLGGLLDAQAETAAVDGERAVVTLRLEYVDGSSQTVDLPLARENSIWRVDSLDPLECVVGW